MQSSRQTWQAGNGFTLIELLLTVGIIAILAGTTISAISPKKNLDDSKDARRRQDLTTMIDALYQYQIDNDDFPYLKDKPQLSTLHNNICVLTSLVPNEVTTCAFAVPQGLPLGPLIPQYLASLPRDPEHPGNAENCGNFAFFSTFGVDCITGYQLWLDADGRIHAFAPKGNDDQGIELTR